MRKSIIIIGAGVAGLSAGCYARMNGYDTQIFEMHDKPGGLCTSWKRKGYVIDGCIHWLLGNVPASDFYPLWDELGAIKGREFVCHEDYVHIYGKNGKKFIAYMDADRLEKHMKELSPEDSKAIEEFVGLIKSFSKMRMPVGKYSELLGTIEKAKMMASMLPYMGAFSKYAKTTAGEYASRFKDPFLREAIESYIPLEGFMFLALIITMAGFHAKTQAYPVGGSLAFAKSIEKRYLDLGGKVQYKAKVGQVITENGRASGVKLTDGTVHKADIIISAADSYETIYDLLEGKYLDDRIKSYIEKTPVFPQIVQVSMGVAVDFSKEPNMQSFLLDKPISVAGKDNFRLMLKHYCYDPTMAPAGKSVLTASFFTDYDPWEKLGKDRASYDAEKDRIANAVIVELEKMYPGITEKVEVVDVATPLTYLRYTGTWQGSYMGWMGDYSSRGSIGVKLPGLKDFYMAGMWTYTNGGVPTAGITGKWAIQAICHEDKKQFITTKI